MRSQKHLYCVADKGETVEKDEDSEEDAEAIDPNEEEAENPRGRGGRGGRGGGGGARTPEAIFKRFDTNEDGSISADELEGNANADRIKGMDKDGDDAVSMEEFTTGLAALQRNGGGGGRGRGGAAAPKRPERPQRPAMSKSDG